MFVPIIANAEIIVPIIETTFDLIAEAVHISAELTLHEVTTTISLFTAVCGKSRALFRHCSSFFRRRSGCLEADPTKNTQEPTDRSLAYEHYLTMDKFGEPVGAGVAKRVSDKSGGVSPRATRTLHYEEIKFPVFGDAINQRERQMIFCRGVSLCMEISRNLEDVSMIALDRENLYVNVALVSSKKDPTADVVSPLNWFRGSDSARALDFTTVKSSLDLHCLPINTDEWSVFMHQRFKLGDFSTTGLYNSVTLMKYTKIHRQIRFDELGEPSNRLFVVYWCAPAATNTAGIVNNKMDIQWNNVMFYDEPVPTTVVKMLKKETKKPKKRKK